MKQSVSLALTWDGARWPIRRLPPKARAFLASTAAPSVLNVAQLFKDDQITELRICWIPCLKGGNDVLSAPFPVPEGRKIDFKPISTIPFGDILGVVYRR
jgi:hypothetical protein